MDRYETDAQTALLESTATLTRIPPESARAYAAAFPSLARTVKDQIGNHLRYRDWLGTNPPQLLSNTHRHHGLFMEELFSTGEFQLLALSLPWVYHACHAHGVPYDYFRAELGYWKQAVAEAMPGERATPIVAVYDWMLAQHDRVIALAELRDEPTDDVDPALAELFGALLEALRAFDDDRLLQVIRGARDDGMGLPELLQGLIYPLMKRIGTLWEEDEITVADEHEATAIMNRVLAALYFDQPFPLPERGLALVAASVNEFHEMGAWMVATCLELDGWDVEYLGANVPEHDLVAKALEVRPQVVALSVSMAFNLRAARSTIAALRSQLPQTRVMIGGQVFHQLPGLADGMGADVCLGDCQEAARWASAHAGLGAGAEAGA